MRNVKETVIKIIEQITNTDIDLKEYFSNNHDISSIGLSSLEYIQMIVFLEEEFEIEFEDEVFQEEYFKDIEKIIQYIETHI